LSLSIASIPGAEDLLIKIDAISAAKRDVLEGYFVPVKIEDGSRGHTWLYLSNLVFQGGGVLGLAHVGFLAGLERAGIRCAGVAGTSAGAIVATVFAAARKSELYAPMASTLLELISVMPMSSFIDGPPLIRGLITRVLEKRPIATAPLSWLGALGALVRLLARRGLNPGDAFEKWLTRTLTRLGVPDTNHLEMHLQAVVDRLTDLGLPRPVKRVDPSGLTTSTKLPTHEMLRVTATGLPAGLKFTFPGDRRLLSAVYASASPALYVRASMAIPGFFEPKRMDLAPEYWREEVRERLNGFVAANTLDDLGRLREVVFVDGGLLSNVQVDAFETMMRPKKARGRNGQFQKSKDRQFPTVVATLVSWHGARAYQARGSVRGLARDLLELAQAVRVQRDRDAWRRISVEPNSSVRLVEIDTSEFNWLNFTMSEIEMGNLFVAGLSAARDFLSSLQAAPK
jgi:NTE family protein